MTDGVANCLTYPDNMFDIVMSGYVIGDDYEGEITEMERVVKNSGWVLDCIGENSGHDRPGNRWSAEDFWCIMSAGLAEILIVIGNKR